MVQLSLRSRIYGPWAGFEREVIGSSQHIGWVRFVGQRRVQLRKSPFLPPDDTKTYLLPDDLVLNEDDLVELSVEGKVSRVTSLAKGSALADDYELLYAVAGARSLTVPMPRPYLDTDGFLSAWW